MRVLKGYLRGTIRGHWSWRPRLPDNGNGDVVLEVSLTGKEGFEPFPAPKHQSTRARVGDGSQSRQKGGGELSGGPFRRRDPSAGGKRGR
ncbi:MAG: hypothetical protein CM15mP18_2830 [Methanobacteriota archaeon]|nr:MAG: hypothetical protein CM15mP18_2830 [Euryarchaeota archaeon]